MTPLREGQTVYLSGTHLKGEVIATGNPWTLVRWENGDQCSMRNEELVPEYLKRLEPKP